MPDIVERAGGHAVLARAGKRSTTVTWEEIAAAAPEVVLVSPCGYNLDESAMQAVSVLEHLPARCDVWAIEADAVMVRPGPRLIEGVEAIAAVLHGVAPLPTKLVRRLR